MQRANSLGGGQLGADVFGFADSSKNKGKSTSVYVDPHDPRFQLKSKMSPVYDMAWKDLVGGKTGIKTLKEITRLQNEKRVMARARI